jgi:hypothetical protein
VIQIAAAMASQPDGSIPQQAGAWSATLATYRWLHNARVAAEAIGQSAFRRTHERSRARPVVLLLQDLSELQSVHALSPTRLYQHTVLAVDGGTSAEVLGLLRQHWFDDPRTPAGESRDARRGRWRRSEVWADAVRAVGAGSRRSRWIMVADREADDFQSFQACGAVGQGWVIRSQHNRYLQSPPGMPPARLRAALAEQPVAEELIVPIPRRSAIGPPALRDRQRPRRSAREARVQVRYRAVTLAPPKGDPRYDQPIAMYAVGVHEPDPPPEAGDPIDWLLLTSEPVNTPADARQIIAWYRRRGLIEDFHQAQKTGCRLEKSQLHDAAAFRRLASLSALVAVRLLQLRQIADDGDLAATPALAHADPLWVTVVAALIHHPDPTTLTVQQFYHAIAQHGGWLARKHDGRPGWLTLWRGWQRIADYVTGIELYQQHLPLPP